MIFGQEKRKGKRNCYFDCGVPLEECSAPLVVSSGPKLRKYKAHKTWDEANLCAKKYAAKRTAEGDGIFIPNKPFLVKQGKSGRAMVPSIR